MMEVLSHHHHHHHHPSIMESNGSGSLISPSSSPNSQSRLVNEPASSSASSSTSTSPATPSTSIHHHNQHHQSNNPYDNSLLVVNHNHHKTVSMSDENDAIKKEKEDANAANNANINNNNNSNSTTSTINISGLSNINSSSPSSSLNERVLSAIAAANNSLPLTSDTVDKLGSSLSDHSNTASSTSTSYPSGSHKSHKHNKKHKNHSNDDDDEDDDSNMDDHPRDKSKKSQDMDEDLDGPDYSPASSSRSMKHKHHSSGSHVRLSSLPVGISVSQTLLPSYQRLLTFINQFDKCNVMNKPMEIDRYIRRSSSFAEIHALILSQVYFVNCRAFNTALQRPMTGRIEGYVAMGLLPAPFHTYALLFHDKFTHTFPQALCAIFHERYSPRWALSNQKSSKKSGSMMTKEEHNVNMGSNSAPSSASSSPATNVHMLHHPHGQSNHHSASKDDINDTTKQTHCLFALLYLFAKELQILPTKDDPHTQGNSPIPPTSGLSMFADFPLPPTLASLASFARSAAARDGNHYYYFLRFRYLTLFQFLSFLLCDVFLQGHTLSYWEKTHSNRYPLAVRWIEELHMFQPPSYRKMHTTVRWTEKLEISRANAIKPLKLFSAAEEEEWANVYDAYMALHLHSSGSDSVQLRKHGAMSNLPVLLANTEKAVMRESERKPGNIYDFDGIDKDLRLNEMAHDSQRSGEYFDGMNGVTGSVTMDMEKKTSRRRHDREDGPDRKKRSKKRSRDDGSSDDDGSDAEEESRKSKKDKRRKKKSHRSSRAYSEDESDGEKSRRHSHSNMNNNNHHHSHSHHSHHYTSMGSNSSSTTNSANSSTNSAVRRISQSPPHLQRGSSPDSPSSPLASFASSPSPSSSTSVLIAHQGSSPFLKMRHTSQSVGVTSTAMMPKGVDVNGVRNNAAGFNASTSGLMQLASVSDLLRVGEGKGDSAPPSPSIHSGMNMNINDNRRLSADTSRTQGGRVHTTAVGIGSSSAQLPSRSLSPSAVHVLQSQSPVLGVGGLGVGVDENTGGPLFSSSPAAARIVFTQQAQSQGNNMSVNGRNMNTPQYDVSSHHVVNGGTVYYDAATNAAGFNANSFASNVSLHPAAAHMNMNPGTAMINVNPATANQALHAMNVNVNGMNVNGGIPSHQLMQMQAASSPATAYARLSQSYAAYPVDMNVNQLQSHSHVNVNGHTQQVYASMMNNPIHIQSYLQSQAAANMNMNRAQASHLSFPSTPAAYYHTDPAAAAAAITRAAIIPVSLGE